MCQVPGSPLSYSWYDGISLIGPWRPRFALHADISRKKCDFLQVLSIGHLAYLFSTSFACVLIEHSFTRISNSYQISLQNIYGYQLCSCILSLQHIRLMQLTFDSPKYLMIESRPQRSSAAQECVHMRASLSQMRASALDFQYRLLRRAIACGATIHSNPCVIWFDATELSLLFFLFSQLKEIFFVLCFHQHFSFVK